MVTLLKIATSYGENPLRKDWKVIELSTVVNVSVIPAAAASVSTPLLTWCGKSFKTEVALNVHRTSKSHKKQVLNTEQCSKCSKKFLTLIALKQHMKDKHKQS